MVRCEGVFRALVRQGLVHLLVDRLAARLREEEGRWALAFELDEEREGGEAQESLWPLRMLSTSLAHAAALRVLDEEVALLSSASSRAMTEFPTAPHPPLFLVLSHLVRVWVLQECFEGDDASTSADDAAVDDAKEAEEAGVARHLSHLSLHSANATARASPLRFPLSFTARGHFLALPAMPSNLPAWSSPLPCGGLVASAADACEVGLRLLLALVRGVPTFGERMQRWWALGRALRDEGGESKDDTDEPPPPPPPEDQSSGWRRALLAALRDTPANQDTASYLSP